MVLVVDLDCTLVKTDTLIEGCLALAKSDLFSLLSALPDLIKNRQTFKCSIANKLEFDPSKLPYNEDVLALIQERKDAGEKIVLATASHEKTASAVADHLGIFDEVYGSNQDINLKSNMKAELLVSKFGESGFDYVGDSKSDIAVWKSAAKCFSVNTSQSLNKCAQKNGIDLLDISKEKSSKIQSFVKALRIYQWIKNVLIFVPMITAHAFSLTTILQSVAAFIAFSVVASAVYLLNDMLDLADDREHPRKKKRPFASGALPLHHGVIAIFALLGLGFALASFTNLYFLTVLLAYLALTSIYSFFLKRYVVIDICTLSLLYTLRIVAGGAMTGIEISIWLFTFSIFFFFSLAAVKRQTELIDSQKRNALKASGRGYHVDDLPLVSNMAVSSGLVSIMVLSLYVVAENVVSLYSCPKLLWGWCLILLFWINRIVMKSHRGKMHDDPIVFAAKDPVSWVCVLFIALCGLGAAIL